MAIIKCEECRKEISDTAKLCPHCGYRQKKKSQLQEIISNYFKKLNFTLIKIFGIIILIISIALSFIDTTFTPSIRIKNSYGIYGGSYIDVNSGILEGIGIFGIIIGITGLISMFITKIKPKYTVILNSLFTYIWIFKYICLSCGIITLQMYDFNLLATCVLILTIVSNILIIKGNKVEESPKNKKYILPKAIICIVVLAILYMVRVNNISDREYDPNDYRKILTEDIIEEIKNEVLNPFDENKLSYYFENKNLYYANMRIQNNPNIDEYIAIEVTSSKPYDEYEYRVYGKIYGKDRYNKVIVKNFYISLYCDIKDDGTYEIEQHGLTME